MSQGSQSRGGQVTPGRINERLAHLRLPIQMVHAFLQCCDDFGQSSRSLILTPELLKHLEVSSHPGGGKPLEVHLTDRHTGFNESPRHEY